MKYLKILFLLFFSLYADGPTESELISRNNLEKLQLIYALCHFGCYEQAHRELQTFEADSYELRVLIRDCIESLPVHNEDVGFVYKDGASEE